MLTSGKWKTTLKRTLSIPRKRLKDKIELQSLQPTEIEFLEKILDPSFSLMNLRHDKPFWKLMGTNNDFNTTVVVTVVATNSTEKVETFFTVVFMKVQGQEIYHKCLQKMYNKFIDTMVAENQVNLLESLFEINFHEWENEDFNPKLQNLPALVKACMNNNYEIVKILVENGFLLRY